MFSNVYREQAYFSLVPQNSLAREVTAHPANRFTAYKKEGCDFFTLSIGPHLKPKGGNTIADVGRIGDVTIKAPHISRIQCSFEIAAFSESEMGYILVEDHSTNHNTQFIGKTAQSYRDGEERQVLIRPEFNEMICFGDLEGECHKFRIEWHQERAELRCKFSSLATTKSQSETLTPPRSSNRVRVPNDGRTMRFSQIGPLGEGAYGKVDLVAGLECGSKLALRQLREQHLDTSEPRFQTYMKRFRREFEFLAKLDHPNILKLVHYQPTPDLQNYQMFTHAKEGNMLDLIREGIFEMKCHVMDFLKQMLSALDYMEVKGVVHRDVKPENILYTTDRSDPDNIRYHYEIGDFNLVNEVICARTTVGTPGFASPELVGEWQQTAKMDIWSLFVTLAYAVNKPDDFRFKLDRIIGVGGGLVTATEATSKLVQEAAKHPYWEDLRGMAEPNPFDRESAGDMLDALFQGQGRTERPRINLKRSQPTENAHLGLRNRELERKRQRLAEFVKRFAD